MLLNKWIKYFSNKAALIVFTLASLVLLVATLLSMKELPSDFIEHITVAKKNVYLDRYGKQLNITYENEWNIHDVVKLHEIPEFLIDAVVLSEDKRFFSHGGVDWLARLNAFKQNVLAGEVVRGASTISEQVVRMIHPRPRTFWSRWLEGFEAMSLEHQHSKLEILEYYLNQVPYKARRRGVVQASRYYFDRDVSTLNKKEMLALSALVRSPMWLDPEKQTDRLDWAIYNLAIRLGMTNDSLRKISKQNITLKTLQSKPDVSHFIEYAEKVKNRYSDSGIINTTIDIELQVKTQKVLDSILTRLSIHNVENGAVLVVNHETNEIISWVVGYAGVDGKKYNKINAVTVRRQPGSALKPLLYAKAIEEGWTAASMLDDSPLEESVGLGMHTYHNYSRDHYGLISLRESLGNSLNIPAVKAIQFVGVGKFLNFLQDLGVKSLTGHPNVYGDGLALGNGEMTLFELVQAYTVMARMGDYKPLSFIDGEHFSNRSHRVLSEDITSLIADIMSDPIAREKEFGLNSVLNFSHQTAVKTGTSSDYRDAWAVGFNDKFTIGVWIGNLDYSEMNEVTGSTGPALVLRSIFNELNKFREVRPLYFSKNLIKKRICIKTGHLEHDECEARDEWFISGTKPTGNVQLTSELRIRKPSNGLMLAMDPRIPDDHEYFEFALTERTDIKNVHWYVNDKLISITKGSKYNWKVSKGNYKARAEVLLNGKHSFIKTAEIEYRVN